MTGKTTMSRRSLLATGASLLATGCAAIPEDVITSRWPPIGETVEVDGLPVHYWLRGEGTPVVLIHGASGNLRDWTFDLAPKLAERYRVIAFDRPGFGYSARVPERGWEPGVQARHLRNAAAALGGEKAIVVGHSWGGALAMAWALAYPGEVRGAVTLGGVTMPWGGDVELFYRLAASDVTGALTGQIVSAFATEERIADRIGSIFAPQNAPAGYAAYVGGPLATRPKVFRYNARDIVNLNDAVTRLSQGYPTLDVPVELIHGTADRTVWAEIHAEGAHELLPQSRVTLLDGIGHMPHHTAPQALIDALDRLA